MKPEYYLWDGQRYVQISAEEGERVIDALFEAKSFAEYMALPSVRKVAVACERPMSREEMFSV